MIQAETVHLHTMGNPLRKWIDATSASPPLYLPQRLSHGRFNVDEVIHKSHVLSYSVEKEVVVLIGSHRMP